ncbi:MAG TPA: type II toxin-antitoxin system VapC family toxin [Rhizomicrobium sp.]|nr:type II toxin-antitoxin system VapC family toxin [Rhizomicrobium sp.]
MSVYLDASVLVALFSTDTFTTAADRAFRGRTLAVVVSDFAAAEFASVIARRFRNKELTKSDAVAAFAAFDGWHARAPARVEVFSADVRAASVSVRQLTANLRAPDAIHLAIARRVGAELATFDSKMASAAAASGIKIFPL